MSDCGGALAKLVLRKMHTKTSLMKLKFSARKAVHDCYQCWKFELKISSDSGDMHFSAIKPRWGGCPPLVRPTTFYSAPSCFRLYFIKDTNGWRKRITMRISPTSRRIHLQRVKKWKDPSWPLPTGIVNATLVAWGQWHLALTSEFFVLLLSRCKCGEESRTDGALAKIAERFAHQAADECTLAAVECPVAGAFQRLSFQLIESSVSAWMKWPCGAWSLHRTPRADD